MDQTITRSDPPADTTTPLQTHDAPWEPFPEIDLRQLLRLTDDTGMFQHALFGSPDPKHGYCIDDNARALIAALYHASLRGHDDRGVPMTRYLSFLAYAYNEKTGRFRNFMGYDRRWLEEVGSQDSQARAFWALGLAVQLAPTEDIRDLAHNLFTRALGTMRSFEHKRSWAFALIGLDKYLAHDPEHLEAVEIRHELAQKLYTTWLDGARDHWPWWDETVTYDNAKLCHALMLSGAATRRDDMLEAGLRSLNWLLDVQTEPDADGGTHLSIIGNDGWLQRGRPRARFDQQPLEAYALTHACLCAARLVRNPDEARQWAGRAWWCFEWFRGRNDLGVPLYHPETGGCQDGLSPIGPNKNQGAESTLAYLLTVLELHRYRAEQVQAGQARVAMPRTIGLGVIGASAFAEFCLDSYAGIEGLKPVAVWNRTASRARKLADRYGLTAHDTLGQLLNDPTVHAIHIATTPDVHADHARAALAAGKHVLIEKPLALNLADADEIIRAAAQRDLVLAANFVMRYGPLTRAVRAIIDSNALGAPLRGQFTNRAGDSGLPEGHWFWDEKISGGIFVEHGVHFFDLARSWLGEGSMLSAHRLRRPEQNLIDQVACDVRFGPQTSVGFYHSFTQSPHIDRQDFRLIFERGEMTLTGWIAADLVIDAVLSDEQADTIERCLPEAQTQTLARFRGSEATTRRRHRQEPIDRRVRITWRDARDKQAIYRDAARALMDDMLASVRDRHYAMQLTHADARAALDLALQADRLAKGITP